MGGNSPLFAVIEQVLIDKDKFVDFFEFFEGKVNQIAGVEQLYEHIRLASPTLLARNAEWMETYRDAALPEPDPGGGCPMPEPKPDNKPGYFTPEMMNQLTGHPASSFDSVFCDDCNRLFEETGFSKHLEAAQMLMANMMHETCNFVYMKEISDGVYLNGRCSDLGNCSPGDGPKYKGAGVLQLTGKYNYQRLADGIGDPKVMDGVDYVADTYPFTSAKIWIEENDLLNVCLKQGFDACCVRINGGWNGYDDRLAKYRICQRVMYVPGV